MLLSEKQRKTVDKLLKKISFTELTIAAPNHGDQNISLTFRGGGKEVVVNLNEDGRKVP